MWKAAGYAGIKRDWVQQIEGGNQSQDGKKKDGAQMDQWKP
jgi:hypothetical protein